MSSACDETRVLAMGVRVKSRAVDTASEPCTLGPATRHEVRAASLLGIASLRVDFFSRIVGEGISYDKSADEWEASLLLISGFKEVQLRDVANVHRNSTSSARQAAISTVVEVRHISETSPAYRLSKPMVIFLRVC